MTIYRDETANFQFERTLVLSHEVTDREAWKVQDDYRPVPGFDFRLETPRAMVQIFGSIAFQAEDGSLTHVAWVGLRLLLNGRKLFHAGENVTRRGHYLQMHFLGADLVGVGEHDLSVQVRSKQVTGTPMVYVKPAEHSRMIVNIWRR